MIVKSRMLPSYCAIVVLFCTSSAFALDTLGSPVARLKKGQFSAGVDYSFTNMDLKAKGKSVLWESWPQCVQKKIKFNNINIHKVYGLLQLGITDELSAFLRVGGANINLKGNSQSGLWWAPSANANWRNDSQPQFAIGFGTRLTLYDGAKLKLGLLS